MGTTTEKLQAALDSKQAVQTALENQGLEVTDDFSTYAGLIDELENTSDSTATSGDIIEGAVAYTASGRTVGTFSPTGDNISYDNATSGMSATNVQGAIDEHVANKSNPHGVTKSQVGLSNVPNVNTNDQTPTYTAASTLSKLVSGEKLSVSFGKIAKAISDLISHLSNKSNPHGVTAAQIGAIPTSQKGTASGVAELDSSGKVPSSQLPAYVDDVLEYTSKSSFPSTGETGKIYVDTTTNKTYRWSGSAYVEISASLALGETSSTAYRGDRGKTAYNHSQVTSGNPHNVTKSDVGLGNVENKSSATIRGELTKANVTDALGYTPPTTNTTYNAATTSAAGLMSADDKSKLDGIASGANKYTHPSYTAKASGLYKVTVDSTGHVSGTAAVTKSDITGLGIPSTNTTYNAATTSAAGLMSADDKSKLDGIASGANKYSHPSYTSKSSGLYKVTVDSTGHVSAATAVTKSDITALGIPGQDTNTTYNNATQSAAGLMSADDKKQIDYGGTLIVKTAGTGAAYTATVDGITELKTGMRLTIIPHVTSTAANATLNVNSLGAKYIRQPLSTNTSATTAGASAGWIIVNNPITLMYNGTYWITESTTITDANNLYGTVPVTKGGTGATTAAAALENLGALGHADVVDNLESSSTDLPLSAKQGKLLKEKQNDIISNLALISTNTNTIVNQFLLGSSNLDKMVFNYDGDSAFWIDFNATTQKIHRIAFDATSIRYLFTQDGGVTWNTIWTK